MTTPATLRQSPSGAFWIDRLLDLADYGSRGHISIATTIVSSERRLVLAFEERLRHSSATTTLLRRGADLNRWDRVQMVQ